MNKIEIMFQEKLEEFERNIDISAQYFYTYQTMHYYVSSNKKIHRYIDNYPLFWLTNLSALRESFFIALGRIYDKNPKSNSLNSLLSFCESNRNIFTSTSTRWNKIQNIHQYEFKINDWNKLLNKVTYWKGIYQINYSKIRNKVSAHSDMISPLVKKSLFSQTKYVELEKMIIFLYSLSDALGDMFNGRKPLIKYKRRSMITMINSKKSGKRGITVGEMSVKATKGFIMEELNHFGKR